MEKVKIGLVLCFDPLADDEDDGESFPESAEGVVGIAGGEERPVAEEEGKMIGVGPEKPRDFRFFFFEALSEAVDDCVAVGAVKGEVSESRGELVREPFGERILLPPGPDFGEACFDLLVPDGVAVEAVEEEEGTALEPEEGVVGEAGLVTEEETRPLALSMREAGPRSIDLARFT